MAKGKQMDELASKIAAGPEAQASQAGTPQNTPTDGPQAPSSEQLSAGTPNPAFTVETPKETPQNASSLIEQPRLAVLDVDPEEIAASLAKLSPDKLAKIRLAAAKAGLADTITGPRKLANGNILVEIEVNIDVIEPIKSWAEQSGLTFKQQVQQLVDWLLPGFLIGGMGTPDVTTTAPGAPAATPGTPAAAAAPPAAAPGAPAAAAPPVAATT